ncbi:MAG TPA: LuxR C-terminal-related transcriptional regulator [Gemmatimonadales bacterium]
MILSNEKTGFGYRVSVRGALRAEGAGGWLKELRETMDRAEGRFGLIIDIRGLEWDDVGAEVIAIPAMLRLRETGVQRIAVVSSDPSALLSLRRLAQETGLYPSQRYFCTALTPDWERAATRWVATGDDEAWPRQSERRAELAMLLDALGEALMLCDESGRLLHTNAALRRALDDEPERQVVLREMEALARGSAPARGTRLMGAPASRSTPATSEREVRTGIRSYRVRHCVATAGLLGPAGAQMVVLQPATAQPLTDCELRERYGLTLREVAVARLLAEGHTNAEIAESLGISPFTARNHTERVLGKLGVSSRAKVASALMTAA